MRLTAANMCMCGIAVLAGFMMVGCNANGWMGDPGAQGYYKPTPTTIPILDRIDIIEEPVVWPQLSRVTPQDLMPSDLTYKIHPGDVLDLQIYGLYATNQHHPVMRRVDVSGHLRVPELGNVLVAGLTAQAAQELIIKELGKIMTHPSVQLEVVDQTAMTYTVYGGLTRWGLFTLHNPDLRLVDALALAGGVPQSTQDIYVIRQLDISDTVIPSWNRTDDAKQTPRSSTQQHQPKSPSKQPTTTPNIEDLINQLDVGTSSPAATPPPAPKPVDDAATSTTENAEENTTDTASSPSIDALINQLDIGDDEQQPARSVSPGIIQTGKHELIDIDDVVPARKGMMHTQTSPPVDIDDLLPTAKTKTTDAAYIYVPETDSWIPVSTGAQKETKKGKKVRSTLNEPVVLERIIEIPWKLLKHGDSSYNIVIRPKDRVYVKGAPLGNLYVRGEVSRPGVYSYPTTGHKITLTEFITSAGGLGAIAVPEKISLTRRFEDVQATITLNYAAILQRTEPDIFLKPNDLISIGTTWGATPMAIIRNGFRTTYGFGFLLDRNFGNDVFGRPP
jgi:polysaccharide biosynthesis/export protein